MTAELAKPDSLGDLAKDDEDEEDYHEHYGEEAREVQEQEEKSSLLTEDQGAHEDDSPSIKT